MDDLTRYALYTFCYMFGWVIVSLLADVDPREEGWLHSLILLCTWPGFVLVCTIFYIFAGIYNLYLKIKK